MTAYAGGGSNGVLYNKDGIQKTHADLLWDENTSTLKVRNLTVMGSTTGITGGSGSATLGGDSDVTVTSPSEGDVLTYSGGKWVNAQPASGTGGGTGGTGSVSKAQVKLTSSQLKNLASTPIQLVAAPGANKLLHIVNAAFAYLRGTVGYTDAPNGYQLDVQYDDNIGLGFSVGVINMLTDGYTSSSSYYRAINASPNNPLATLVNRALRLAIPFPSGALATIDLAGGSGGTGYAVGDTGTLSNGSAGGTVTYTVTSVDGSGAVTGLTIVPGGSGYVIGTQSNGVNAGSQPGSGSGLYVIPATLGTLDELTGGDGELIVTVYYDTIDVS